MSENKWRAKWTKEQIKAMLLEQFDTFWTRETGIVRAQLATIEQATSLPHAVIISGLRRVGKSTLLAQMAHKLGQNTFYYLNFEDDRFLGFKADDITALFEILVELFGERQIFIIDEIQNIPGWEHFVRRFMDMDYKFYITGSNASLLSRELGTRLTGRYVPIELFPFSFQEFLSFNQEPQPDFQRMKSVQRAKVNRALHTYLNQGGIPDALRYPDFPLLQTLYDDILYRDIATRYHLNDVAVLKELAFYLISNPTTAVSFNKLKARFQLGSVNTIKSYVSYLENSWLIFTLTLYDLSVKRQQIAPKKIYTIDNGLSNTVGFNFSPNTGQLLENQVFLALRRQTDDIYYYNTPKGYEIDFYLPKRGQLIQVTQHLENPTTRQREIRALEDAVKGNLKVQSALILADANEDSFMIGDVLVHVKSAAEWLISQENHSPEERSV